MKPLMILDNHFRQRDELFSADTYAALSELVDIHGGVDQPMPRSDIMAHLPDAAFYVSARPELSVQDIAQAPNLKATIEVAGAFRDGLEYTACLDRGIEVLSCSPGFRNAVAEMALAMMLGAGRGLVAEHEAFRTGSERWLDDRTDTDFTLYNQTIGFIGFGQIARETHRLLAPFSPRTMAYDPFVTDAGPDVDCGFGHACARLQSGGGRGRPIRRNPWIAVGRTYRGHAARDIGCGHQPRVVR